MKDKTIYSTIDYNKFKISHENRDIDLSKPSSKRLRKSLKDYGWLTAFPMMCRKNTKGELIIIDGQHRFTIAREIGIEVLYVVDNTHVDVSEINQAQSSWRPVDYLNRWIKEGKEDYIEVENFKSQFGSIPLGVCASLLAGTYSFSNIKNKFQSGTYVVKTRDLAYQIGRSYERIVDANKDAKSANFLKALYACYYVEDFDSERLIESCEKRPHMIASYSKIEDYLKMIEEIYNHGYKSGRIPLEFLAKEAMKKRAPTG